MKRVLGIDTGGTYTDAVLMEPKTSKVLLSAKSPTTHQDLSTGIINSIQALGDFDTTSVEKVVMSTTLATNAIVEGKGRPTALILIGERPKGELPIDRVYQVKGKVNIKGKEVIPIDQDEVEAVCREIGPEIEAVAVSGMMSVRNARQELLVKEIVEKQCGLPVICSHELSSKLGFTDRTVTAVLNASLIPIIKQFIDAVKKALTAHQIDAKIFMVKGDGNLASLDFILKKPIESILSGPAASIIGALRLAGTGDGIVVDMGGTTTDSGLVEANTLALSAVGARVGEWQTQIDSAMINTFGLGGDSQILPEKGQPVLKHRRILPACRGGKEGITPTDCLHYTGDFSQWDSNAANQAILNQARKTEMTADDYAQASISMILDTIQTETLALYDSSLPIIAIGAPAGAWYTRIREKTGRQVIIPEHFEVANAVGAAMAAVEERVEALVRPDEEEDAFVAHIAGEWGHFDTKEEAVAYASHRASELAEINALNQGADSVSSQVFVKDIIDRTGWKPRYVKTEIQAVAKATTLKLKEE